MFFVWFVYFIELEWLSISCYCVIAILKRHIPMIYIYRFGRSKPLCEVGKTAFLFIYYVNMEVRSIGKRWKKSRNSDVLNTFIKHHSNDGVKKHSGPPPKHACCKLCIINSVKFESYQANDLPKLDY